MDIVCLEGLQSSLCGKAATNAAAPNGAKRSTDLLASEAAVNDRVLMPNLARHAGCVPHSLMGTIMGTAPQCSDLTHQPRSAASIEPVKISAPRD